MDKTIRPSRPHRRVENSISTHRLSIITSGSSFFDELVRAIDAAKSDVYLETYILSPDRIGSLIIESLLRAARRGVTVRLLVDGVGSSLISQEQIILWKSQGILIHVFRPLRHWYSLKQMVFRRLHRKIAVIDRKVAFVGGMNIHEQQLGELDYTLKVEGIMAKRIHRYVMSFFFRVSSQWLSYLKVVSRRNISLPIPFVFRRKTNDLDFIVRDNIVHRNQIEDAYLEAISKAEREILLANAYFLPRRRFRQALRMAAKRGVRVELLLQGQTDIPLMKWATQSLYYSLLQDGIQIYEYQASVLHAKVAVIDGSWVTVGSANLDIFSLLLNLEANIVARDPRLAAELRSHLRDAIQNGAVAVRSENLSMSLRSRLQSKLSLWIFRVIRFVSGSRREEE